MINQPYHALLLLAAIEMAKMTMDAGRASHGSPAWNKEFYRCLEKNLPLAANLTASLPKQKTYKNTKGGK